MPLELRLLTIDFATVVFPEPSIPIKQINLNLNSVEILTPLVVIDQLVI